jgi:hypothetical protein
MNEVLERGGLTYSRTICSTDVKPSVRLTWHSDSLEKAKSWSTGRYGAGNRGTARNPPNARCFESIALEVVAVCGPSALQNGTPICIREEEQEEKARRPCADLDGVKKPIFCSITVRCTGKIEC